MKSIDRSPHWLRAALSFCLVSALGIVGWQTIVTALGIPSYLVPTPSEIFAVFVASPMYFVSHASTTLMEAALGLLAATVVGGILGLGFAFCPPLERLALPHLVALQAVPIVAIAPLLVLWFGNGLQSKVVMAAILCFFPVAVNTARGLKSVSRGEIRLFHCFGATRWQTLWKLRVPRAVGSVMSGVRVAASLATIGAIVAEYAGANRGIGYVITQATYRLDTPVLFCAILCAMLGGLALFGVVVGIERSLLWRYLF